MNTDRGFIYSFDMSEEIPHFKHMPEDVQSSAERNAVDVIYESFVIPGDQDYLMSRLLAQKGLPRGFYWAAAQATEKYLKAFLLMSGVKVKDFRSHKILELFQAAEKIDSTFSDFEIQPHTNIRVAQSASEHLMKFTVLNFIKELDMHGSADNRYNTFGVEYNTGHLFAMDSLSFQLRRKISVLPIRKSFTQLNQDLLTTFARFNPWFEPHLDQIVYDIPSKEFPIEYSSSVTKLEILLKHKSNPAYALALQWLGAKMKLPKQGA